MNQVFYTLNGEQPTQEVDKVMFSCVKDQVDKCANVLMDRLDLNVYVSFDFVNRSMTSRSTILNVTIMAIEGNKTIAYAEHRVYRDSKPVPGYRWYLNKIKLDPRIQNQNISGVMNCVSRYVSDELKNTSGPINRIQLRAGMKAGGYVWARKGFLPKDFKVWRNIVLKSSRDGKISGNLCDKFLQMTDEQIKNFVLTNEFREYQPAFLRTAWTGNLDTSDTERLNLFTNSDKKVSSNSNSCQVKYIKPML